MTGLDMTKIHEVAQQLVNIHGDKAELEAARREHDAETAGDRDGLETWRRIRAAIVTMRGPRST